MPSDYVDALLGGVIIGTASVLLFLLLGRIAGISGIFWQAITSLRVSNRIGSDSEADGKFNNDSFSDSHGWQIAFIIGLVLGPLFAKGLLGWQPPEVPEYNLLLLFGAGLLVGAGSRLGSGCTSGHGVCGIGRLSRRSLVATAVFISTGILTTTFIRHGLG